MPYEYRITAQILRTRPGTNFSNPSRESLADDFTALFGPANESLYAEIAKDWEPISHNIAIIKEAIILSIMSRRPKS